MTFPSDDDAKGMLNLAQALEMDEEALAGWREEMRFLGLELAYGDDPRISEVAQYLSVPITQWSDKEHQWVDKYLKWRKTRV